MALLSIMSILFFALFTRYINKGYLETFFTTTTAKQFHCQKYHDAVNDSARLSIFSLHPSYYNEIRGEVCSFVRDNWERWNDEKPEWFTTRVRASVPLDMIPKD